jgi:glycosyltransferase involved in cell wall biosynthesis
MGKALAKEVIQSVYFIPTLEIGGAERQLLSICRSLSHKEQVIVMSKRKGQLRQEFVDEEFQVIYLPNNPILFAGSAVIVLLLLAVKRQKILVEAFLSVPILLSAIAKSVAPRRIVLIGNRRSHLFYREGRSLFGFLDHWGTLKCDFLVCNSDSVQREAIEIDGVSPKIAMVIPNGISVSPESLSKNWRQVPSIFHVANHHKYKRTMTLLTSVADSNFLRSIEVHLFGFGKETSELMEFVKKFELDNVTFHGQVHNPWRTSAPGDIYVHTSETEGFSNSVLEAMAHGLIPVITDIDANHYVAGNVAEYFPVGDHVELRKLLERLIHDTESRVELSHAGVTRVQSEFSISSMSEKRFELHNHLWSTQS